MLFNFMPVILVEPGQVLGSFSIVERLPLHH